jgi:hypothetical protein
LARVIYKILLGNTYKDIGYKRGDPKEQKIRNLLGKLQTLGVNISYYDKQNVISKRVIQVDSSGIILS